MCACGKESDGEKKKIEKLSRTKLLPKAIFFNVNVDLRTRKKKRTTRKEEEEEEFSNPIRFLEQCPHTLFNIVSLSFSLPKQFIIEENFSCRLNIVQLLII